MEKPKTVAEFFSRPGTHCKYLLGQDANGNPIDPEYNRESIPVQCCIVGAAMYVYPGTGRASDITYKLADSGGFATISDLVDWNNAPERTQEEIYALAVKAGV